MDFNRIFLAEVGEVGSSGQTQQAPSFMLLIIAAWCGKNLVIADIEISHAVQRGPAG